MRPLLWILLVLVPRAVAAAPCDPAVLLEGPAALRKEVAAQLARQGLHAPAAGCPGLRVRLHARGGGLQVTQVEDPTSARSVADAPAAATVIESWLRSDISDPLLGTHPVIVTPRPASVDPPLRAPQVAPPPPALRGILALRLESAVASDGSVWLGGGAQACGRVGPLCVGLLGRAAEDLRAPALAAASALQRWDVELLLSAQWLWTRGRLTLGPGVALGGGAVVQRVRNAVAAADLGGAAARAELLLHAGVRLAAGLGLDVGLGLGLRLPNSGGVAVLYNGRSHDGEPLSDVLSVPAAPWGAARLHLGLRWGIL